VHRLIRSRTDGKLVELPSLVGGGNSKGDDTASKALGGPDRSTEESQDKLEAMGVEYANLMTSQLESQRGYYEEEIARSKDEIVVLRRKWEENIGDKEKWRKEKSELEKRLDEVVAGIKKEKEALQARLDVAARIGGEEEARRKKERAELVKARKELERELEAERAVTASLTTNLGHLRVEMGKREQETIEVRAEVEDMREQMRDVMFTLSARDQIEAEGGTSEMAGGSVSVPVPPSTPASRRKKKR
jgi:BRCA1-associated protein